MSKQIVNIINFVRGTEPRLPMDLLGTLNEQLKALKESRLKATVLFQYDALCDERFVQALQPYSDNIEVGLWIELVRTSIEKVGDVWRGEPEWEWDWHGNVCNTVGYTPEIREKLVDESMRKFKAVFGYYPASVGAWAMDAVTLAYLEKKYCVAAACNCKEQWGTDGYTLWGGYYGQAYYPSRFNSLCPAQTLSSQINIPVFRMLGSDPIYQYDAGLNISGEAAKAQPVVTLEPVYAGNEGGGGEPKWVDWYLSENFSGKCMSFAYTQAGQENSFGWERIKDGYLYQLKKIRQLAKENKIEVMTLKEAGEWYQSQFKQTPACVIVAETDWKGKNRKTYWYCCNRYRANVYAEDSAFWIRDIFYFDERYPERYLDSVCQTEGYVFDTLPVMDGNRFSGNGIRAGLYPCNAVTGERLTMKSAPVYGQENEEMTVVFPTDTYGGIRIVFSVDGITVTAERNAEELCFKFVVNPVAMSVKLMKTGTNTLSCNYRGFGYRVVLNKGHVGQDDGGLYVYYASGKGLKIQFEGDNE